MCVYRNRSILAYLSTLNVSSETIKLIKRDINEKNNDNIIAEDENIDQAEVRKQAQVLEKKWTSVVRLQRKVLDLETQVSNLKLELESSGPIRGTNKGDPVSWLPRAPAKYSLSGHRQPVTSVAFHPIFSVLASACEDGSIKIWDWELGELERTLKAHTKSVVDLDFGGSKGQIYLASCSSDLTIKLWDPLSDYANIRTLTGHDHTISSVRFIPSGTHLVSASRDKTIRIWDVTSGYCVRTIYGHSDWIKSVCPSIDGSYLLSCGIDQSARISSFLTGEQKLTFIGHEHVIEIAVFAPQSSYEYLSALEGLKQPVQSTYSSSFEYIATASRDKTIKLWNTRQEVIRTLEGHDNWIRGLVFHPCGKYLLSVSDDKTIRCWDLSQQARCVKVLNDAHSHFVSCIRWCPPTQSINENEAKEATEKEPNGDTDKSKKKKQNNWRNVRCVIATGSVDLDVKVWM